MSAFAGIFNFNGKPIGGAQREQLAILWQSLQFFGPDGGDILFQGPVAMCYRAFHTSRESRFEIQPFVGHDNSKLVANLRLDNRKELISDLREHLIIGDEEITDVELALAAYHKWGEMFPLHLVGEFAFTLHDPKRQQVVLARDHIGARPLYYHHNDERLICSSELGPLLEVVGIPLEVNDEFVAGYLMYDPEPELTAYKNIHSVKPFHIVTFTADGLIHEKRYWDLGTVKPIRYKADTDYEEEFNLHFRNAVAGPLRTDRPVFSDLSGGLDSSSIVCVADQLIRNRNVQATELFTVSLVSTGSPTSDQTTFIRDVEEHIDRTGYHIDENDAQLFSTLSVKNALPSLNALLFCEAKHRRISSLMQQADARVVLSGIGGDEITCNQQNPAPELADLLRRFQFCALHEGLKAWSQRRKRPYLSLLCEAVRLLLPYRLKMRARLKAPGIVPVFLNSKFSSDFDLRQRHVASCPFVCETPSAMDQALGFWTAMRGIAAGYRRELTRGNISYPFLARPLVEFMQAIPLRQRVQAGKSRFLMRRALKEVLPPAILKRRDKGNPQETIARAFMREWPRLKPFFENSRISAYGYVDGQTFLSAVEDYRLGKNIHLAMLLKLLSLEFWLRRLESVTLPSLEPSKRFSYQKLVVMPGANDLHVSNR